jgi:uncharacterized protein (TIGR03435 family)
MKTFRIAVALLLALSVSMPLAQPPAAAKDAPPPATGPLLVDVHPSPYRLSLTYTVKIGQQRFEMRNATIVNMIDYVRGQPDDDGREDLAVAGGPTWIDLDRFDVVARIPDLKAANPNPGQPNYGIFSATPDPSIQPIVERILTERFHLKIHPEDRPLPGYIMTVGRGGAKLTEAKDLDVPNSCQGAPDKADPGQILIACTSETLTQFLETFGGNFRHPIIDRTGLTKAYDFTLRVSSEQLRTREGAIHAYIDAIGKQLGLTIAPADVSQPAMVVDAVDRTPTPNPPDIAKLIPPLPDLEFEVAAIKLAGDKEPQDTIRPGGSQITFSAFNLQGLLTRAFELSTGAMLGDALATLSPQRYTILAKLPPGVDARAVIQDQDQLDDMLRKLLIDRFQIKYHWGQWTQPDAYVLLADTPKMKKADPNSRSFCKYGPPEGERDVRTTGSAFNGMFHCQNVTMAQFADLVQSMAKSEIKNRVPDRTGLAGSYDFTLYYTGSRKMTLDAAAALAAAKQSGDATVAPPEGISIEDAFRKQLGLRLEKRPLTLPALVLDHIEQKPTDN